MTAYRHALSLLLVLAVVSGCGGDPAPSTPTAGTAASQPGDADVAAPEEAWDESAAPAAGARMSITPDPVPFCDAKRQAVEVSWDVAAAAPKHLQLWIESQPGKRKLWVETKTLAGTKRTGPWVAEGARFVALDAHGRRVLAAVTVRAAPCG